MKPDALSTSVLGQALNLQDSFRLSSGQVSYYGSVMLWTAFLPTLDRLVKISLAGKRSFGGLGQNPKVTC